MKATHSALLGGAIAIAAASLAVAAPASAKTVHVSGLQTPVDATHSTMTGGLIGDWTTDAFNVTAFDPTDGSLQAAGEEHFNGCVDANETGACDRRDPAGTLYFTFTFFGQFDLTTGAQLSGRCTHPIVGGTDGFRHARGILYFVDDVTTGTSSYVGHVGYRRSDVKASQPVEMARPRVANALGTRSGCA
jgi:hypothetical protein